MKTANFSNYSINTTKHPRTLTEAFGPYGDNLYYSPEEKNDWIFWGVGVVFLVAIIFLCGVLS